MTAASGNEKRANVDYWSMPARELSAAWREVFTTDYSNDPDGSKAERFSFVEDAILQRAGAPDDVSSDDSGYLAVIQEWARVNA